MRYLNADVLDAVIVGGGLSGLSVAAHLAERGRSFMLLEARPRWGGRAWSRTVGHSAGRYDLGPAWMWPGQPKMSALTQRFGLTVFEQFDAGKLVFEDERGRVRRDLDLSPMQGALRIEGGLSALIDALADTIDRASMAMSAHVERVVDTGDGVAVSVRGQAQSLPARRVILAIPPRVAQASITFDPPLSDPQQRALDSIPTWMAGHAKFLAVYREPFWRSAGLSGSAMSRRGPLAEIHDASAPDVEEAALFGFVGTPAPVRAEQPDALQSACVQQLAKLFGPKASAPSSVTLLDWAQDPYTATVADHQPLHGHPRYGLPAALADLWSGRIRFASTEVARESGGLLEGALEAAAAAVGAHSVST